MAAEDDGWFGMVTGFAAAGTLYDYRIDGGQHVPDPASRYQPDDVHGPSQVVDPERFDWQDGHWRGRPWEEAVIYEMHTGAGSEQGRLQRGRGTTRLSRGPGRHRARADAAGGLSRAPQLGI